MNLIQQLFTKNRCAKNAQYITPVGVMWHSTGAPNNKLSRYVPSNGYIEKNANNNHWDDPNIGVCVHGFIGLNKDKQVMTVQTLPWNVRGWHCGSGKKGSGNSTHISFEICEDNLADPIYFDKVYNEAIELTVQLCMQFNIPAAKVISHAEGHKLGIATNHADPDHWMKRYGRTMQDVRLEVDKRLKNQTVYGDIEFLVQKGIITNPQYWKDAVTLVPNLKFLFEKIKTYILDHTV